MKSLFGVVQAFHANRFHLRATLGLGLGYLGVLGFFMSVIVVPPKVCPENIPENVLCAQAGGVLAGLLIGMVLCILLVAYGVYALVKTNNAHA